MEHLNLESLIIELSQKLISRGEKVVTAESCTGGGLAYELTAIAGSSAWFDRGFITYSDQSKIDMVNVNPATLKSFGAVSRETAVEMANGALQHSQAQISVSITGIAGPTGGTATKPVGTVWIACASAKNNQVDCYHFQGDRSAIRKQSLVAALQKLILIT